MGWLAVIGVKPLIAAHPNAYDSLLTWLGENGGPDVKSAIASRGGSPEPTSVLPQQAPPVAGPPITPPPSGGPGLPPPGGYQPPPTGFPAPGSPQGGGSGSSKKGLWITLIALVSLLVISGIGVGVWALTKGDDDSDRDTQSDPTDDPTDEPTDDSDRDNDDDSDDQSSGDADCDVLQDVYDASNTITFEYFPESSDPSELSDAVAVLEDNDPTGADEVDDAVQVILTLAAALEVDPEAAYGDEFFDAADALREIESYIDAEC